MFDVVIVVVLVCVVVCIGLLADLVWVCGITWWFRLCGCLLYVVV